MTLSFYTETQELIPPILVFIKNGHGEDEHEKSSGFRRLHEKNNKMRRMVGVERDGIPLHAPIYLLKTLSHVLIKLIEYQTKSSN